MTAADAINVGALGRISATTVGGQGGTIALQADSIRIIAGGQVSAASAGSGTGGDVVLIADRIVIDGAVLSASGNGSGRAGTVRVTASDELVLNDGSLRTSAPQAAGGNIEIAVGRRVLLTDSEITAEAGGVTATDGGGNIDIDPEYVILRSSDISARANAGNGGNIAIAAGFFIASGDSTVDASSTRGVDGNVLIDSPNEITGSVLPLDAPPPTRRRAHATLRAATRRRAQHADRGDTPEQCGVTRRLSREPTRRHDRGGVLKRRCSSIARARPRPGSRRTSARGRCRSAPGS